jgi:hypothetical protein
VALGTVPSVLLTDGQLDGRADGTVRGHRPRSSAAPAAGEIARMRADAEPVRRSSAPRLWRCSRWIEVFGQPMLPGSIVGAARFA